MIDAVFATTADFATHTFFSISSSRGVEQLQHGPVPVPLQVTAVWLLQKELHLPAGEDLGQLALHLRRSHVSGWVALHQSP